MVGIEPKGLPSLESIGTLDRQLRATSLVATLLIPVAVVFFEGTLMHPIVALAAITSGLAFLWRARGKLVHGKLLVGLAVTVSASWPSVDTPNPATSGHLKTGHHGSGRDVFILGLTGC